MLGWVVTMRTRGVGAGLTALVVLSILIPAVASSAQDVRFRHYRGRTPEGDELRVTTYTLDGTTKLYRLFYEATLGCEDGTETWVGQGFSHAAYPMPPDRIDHDDVWTFEALHIHGRLGVRGGSGTFSYAFPMLTADEQAQLCTTGERTWDLRRVAAERKSLPAEGRIRITSGPGGASHIAATSEPDRGTGIAVTPSEISTEGSPLRRYRGRSSQDFRMTVWTQEVDSAIELRRFRLGWNLTCEDGTGSFWRSFLPLFPFFPVTSPLGRLDFDSVGGQQALHVRGRLGTHGGSGAITVAVAVLTADEQAQVCGTADLTWRLWRIDAGARILP